MPSIKGTASVSDARAMSKALKSTKFPSNFSKRVNLARVNRLVLLDWIEARVTKILGFEDEIVTSMAGNLFLPESDNTEEVDPRRAQINLAGFLGDDQAAEFAKDLWNLLLEAQTAPQGVPRVIMEEKKRELEQQKKTQPQSQQRNSRGFVPDRGIRRDNYGPPRGGGDRWGGRDDRYPPPGNYRNDNYHNNGPPRDHFRDHRGGDRDRGPPRYGDRDYGGRGPPPRDYGGPPPRDYPRYPPRPVSPHGDRDDRRGPPPMDRDDRRGGPPPPPRYGGGPPPVEDEFGRARMPPREGGRPRSPPRGGGRSPDDRNMNDRRPPPRDNSFSGRRDSPREGRRDSRERHRDNNGRMGGGGSPHDKPKGASPNATTGRNGTPNGSRPQELLPPPEADNNKRTNNGDRSPPRRSPSRSSSEDSYDRRRRRRRKDRRSEERRPRRHHSSRSSRKQRDRRDRSSDDDSSQDERHHRKRRGGRDSRSRSRSRDRRRGGRSPSSGSSQYSD